MSIAADPNRWTTMRTAAVMAASCSGLLVNVLTAVTGVLARELGFQPSMLGAFASANSLGGLAGGIAAIVAALSWHAVFAMLGLILIPPLLLARHFPKDYRR